MRRVTELLDEGGPSPTVAATGRQRLDELIAQAPAAGRPRTGESIGQEPAGNRPREVPSTPARVPSTPSPRRRRIRWALPGLGLVAVGAATAIALTVTATPPARPPHPVPSETAQRLSGREVLLTAASSAESAPPATGEYWHIRWIHAITVNNARPVGNVFETWAAKDGRWYMGTATLDGRGLGLNKEKHKNGASFELEDHMLSFDQLRRLPADPQRLTAWTRTFSRGLNASWRKKDVEDSVTGTLSALLYAVPVSPKVRAAAFRALAQRPGVTTGGRAKDVRGRVGQAVSIGSFHLIIDPKTAFVLQETTGTVDTKTSSTLYYEVGWTNEEPHVPSAS
ncbi:CU044_5270 family protein [Actinoallomurus sp. NPDC050550]|uniref:CU044_5270 family protein n=1 Tax=Actinoallomurus sp. NPDC050550 TaxID=3154937 RepID=UPI0033CBA8D7